MDGCHLLNICHRWCIFYTLSPVISDIGLHAQWMNNIGDMFMLTPRA